jgi:hypothetical protein
MKEVENLDTIAIGTDLLLKKVAAKKIFGSHLILSNGHARFKIQNNPRPRPITALVKIESKNG